MSVKGNIFRCRKHSKEAFTSKERALARLDEVLAAERAGTDKTPHRAHYDDDCGFWHLTSERRTRSETVAEEGLARKKGRL
jgi:hypothetical protein